MIPIPVPQVRVSMLLVWRLSGSVETHAQYSMTTKERETFPKFTNVFYKGSGGNI